MPILTLQRQMRELGRIRLGQQVAGANGRKRPSKLSTFRLTSPAKHLLDQAAAEYQGTVKRWADAPEGEQWELIIESPTLDVMVPPGQSLSQWMEMWTGGGCARRCDGYREVLSDSPCLCPPDPADRVAAAADGKACKPTTRLNVILPKLPDLGVWRLESHGFYAAVELAGTAEILAAATAHGVPIAARLRIDRRKVKRPGQPTKDFIVPVLELPEWTPGRLLAAPQAAPQMSDGRQAAPMLGAGGRPAIPAAPPVPGMAAKPPEPQKPEPVTDAEPVEGELVVSATDAGALTFGEAHPCRLHAVPLEQDARGGWSCPQCRPTHR